MITGQTLIDMGFQPGPWFTPMLKAAKEYCDEGVSLDALPTLLKPLLPPPLVEMRDTPAELSVFLDATNEVEERNKAEVLKTMDGILHLPTAVAGWVMPDACPSGTIPVGCAVETEGTIHPGLHSADLACGLLMSTFGGRKSARQVFEEAKQHVRFGPEPRELAEFVEKKQLKLIDDLLDTWEGNPFLQGLDKLALSQFRTQGDGNHFLSVGNRVSDNRVIVTTHHGSRGLGAAVYKRGMHAAKRYTQTVAKGVPPSMAWLHMDTPEGAYYLAALKALEKWTIASHRALHAGIAAKLGVRLTHASYCAHNTVVPVPHGRFLHLKGVSRYNVGSGVFLPLPLSMRDPILLVQAGGALPAGRKLLPHGAGRNLSRNAHRKALGDFDVQKVVADEVGKVKVHFYSGVPDVTELPSAYKNADEIERQVVKFNLATVVDSIQPYGTIMAGSMPNFWEK